MEPYFYISLVKGDMLNTVKFAPNVNTSENWETF